MIFVFCMLIPFAEHIVTRHHYLNLSVAYDSIMGIIRFHWLILYTILREYAWAYIIFVLFMLVSFIEHILTRQFCCLLPNNDHCRIPLVNMIFDTLFWTYIIFVLGMLVPFVEYILNRHHSLTILLPITK